MKYKAFYLENFKGVDKIRVELKEGIPICLLGSNEAGKTTVLRGIECFGQLLRDASLGLQPSEIAPKVFPFNASVILGATVELDKSEVKALMESLRHKYVVTPVEAPEDVEAEEESYGEDGEAEEREGAEEEEEDSEDYEHELSNWEDMLKKAGGIVEIKYVYPFENSECSGVETEVICQGKKCEWDDDFLAFVSQKCPEIVYTDDVLFRVPEKIRFLNPKFNVSEGDAQYEKYKKYQVDPTLKDNLNLRWQGIFSDLLSASQTKGQYMDFQESVVDVLAENPDSLEQMRQATSGMQTTLNREIVKAWAQTIGQKTFSRITLQDHTNPAAAYYDYDIRVEAGSNTFPLQDRSKGVQWFFCFMILTKIKAARAPNGIVFLLDEPATNLHIDYQARIYDAIKDLASKTGVSVLYATHAPSLTPKTEEVREGMVLVHNKFRDRLDQDAAKKIVAKNYTRLTATDRKLFGNALAPCIQGNIVDTIENLQQGDGRGKELADRLLKGAKIVVDTLAKAGGLANLIDKIPWGD